MLGVTSSTDSLELWQPQEQGHSSAGLSPGRTRSLLVQLCWQQPEYLAWAWGDMDVQPAMPWHMVFSQTLLSRGQGLCDGLGVRDCFGLGGFEGLGWGSRGKWGS